MNALVNVLGGGFDSSSPSINYDSIYVNETGDNMQGNLNMKNNRILNLGEAMLNTDATNKEYVDNKINDKIDLLNKINKINNEIDKFYVSPLQDMLIYYNIALNHKPLFWISSKFPHGLFPKLHKIIKYDIFSDIVGHKVVKGLTPNTADAIFAQNINIVENGFSLDNTNQNQDKISRITIDYEFNLNYTFVFVTNNVLFTGTLPNRNFGWRGLKNIFKVGLNEFSTNLRNCKLHCFIVRCNNGIVDFWDFDENITNNKSNVNFIVAEDFGKIVIGQPLHPADSSHYVKGKFFELMLFDTVLSTTEIENIKTFLKKYYDFSLSAPTAKVVVDQSVLQNLS